ncbi:ATP-binding protein [Clostridium sp. E02]|uniref:ATP-binding protein n=1 Tax=Clostridium sp. E02 TaxID=2487134 RepID=UPI000F53292F|nr:ATP-binding protein [Clostridium sp. E02]
MNLRLKKISMENFKGITQLVIDFQERTTISGQNATGKTTIMDGFTWLLFNKDSEGKSDFNIRPNDSQGKPIDNVVIKVSATLEADGKETLLVKAQEQNWVKKKGSEVSQLQGNINKYEINEIPKSEKDYKAYINGLMSEELFKLITSPQTFTSLKWKDQRTILLKLVSEVTDQDVISTDQKFSLLSDTLKEFSVDDLTAKAKKALKELNKRQTELPARIDEASKGLVQADFTECENQKADLEKQINDLEEQENSASKASEAIAEINNAIMQKQFDISDLKRKLNEDLMNQRRGIQRRIDDAGYAFSDAIREYEKTEREIQQKQELLESNRSYREALLKNHKEVHGMQVNADSLCCPMCKQTLPPEQREAKLEEFQSIKQKSLDDIVKNGKQTAANIETLEKEISTLKEKLEACKTNKVELNKRKTAAMEELAALSQQVEVIDSPEYQSISAEIQSLEKQVQEMGTGSGYLNQLRQKKEELIVQLDRVKSTLTGKENNLRVQARVLELQQEQRTTSQLIADQEKELFLLEEFTKAKMDLLSSRINSKFKIVNFRLFETQINGGYKETCECMVNGVPFNSLNTGHRVVAGLDIISALQEIYQVSAPIFIDNAESVNDFNIPNMEGQLVLLKVSENSTLEVEV